MVDSYGAGGLAFSGGTSRHMRGSVSSALWSLLALTLFASVVFAASAIVAVDPASADAAGGSTSVAGLSDTMAKLDVGDYHSCAVRSNATVVCWGENGSGQLGDGTTTTRTSPVAVAGITGATGVAAGAEHSCTVLGDTTVRCWGDNSSSQLGDASIRNSAVPVTVLDEDAGALAGVVAISAGGYHTCALLSDTTVSCWGWNGVGQLGDGTTIDSSIPTFVSDSVGTPMTGFTSVAAGGEHSCGGLSDGSLVCWGWNGSGALGNGLEEGGVGLDSPVPLTVSTLANTVGVSTGTVHSCAVEANASMSCWGWNDFGAVGDGTTVDATEPQTVVAISGVQAVASGSGQSCAILTSDGVSCWGANESGQLGDGSTTPSVAPRTVTSTGGQALANAVALSTGLGHGCAGLADGSAWCWGSNFAGQLGDGSSTRRLAAVQVPGLQLAVADSLVTSPAPGSTLACVDPVLTWGGPASNTEFWVYAGSSLGDREYFDSGSLAVRSVTMTGLPTDGSTVFVRLWSRPTGGTWAIEDVTYQACSDVDPVVSPASGSTFNCGDVLFTWSDTADEYWLYAGSFLGGSNYVDSGSLGGATTTTVSGLPTDGSTVFVRFWFRDTNGTWDSIDLTYTACSQSGPILNPPSGSTLTCSPVPFSFTAPGLPDEFWLYAGSSTGASDYFDSGRLTSPSVTVPSIPSDGSTVYVRFWFRSAGDGWQSIDGVYTSCSDVLTFVPAPGATLACGSQLFEWPDTDDEYWLYVGSELGSNNYFNSGPIGGATSVLGTGLPDDGSTVHVRFYSRPSGGTWTWTDVTYSACSAAVAILSPAVGSTLACGNIATSWSPGQGNDEFWLYAGSTPGAFNYYNSKSLSNPSTTMTGLPANGQTIYLRLWYRSAGDNWSSIDATYIACT